MYRLLPDGTLQITHISLESVLEIYKINKQILNFHSFIRAQMLKRHIEHLSQKMQKVGYGMDQKLVAQIERNQTFKLEDYLEEIQHVWNQVDHAQNKEISKTKFYRFLNDQKLVLNADQSKVEDMLK